MLVDELVRKESSTGKVSRDWRRATSVATRGPKVGAYGHYVCPASLEWIPLPKKWRHPQINFMVSRLWAIMERSMKYVRVHHSTILRTSRGRLQYMATPLAP